MTLDKFQYRLPPCGLAVSPDGNSVLYVRFVARTEGLMLMENFHVESSLEMRDCSTPLTIAVGERSDTCLSSLIGFRRIEAEVPSVGKTLGIRPAGVYRLYAATLRHRSGSP